MAAPTRMKLPKGKVWDFSKKGYMDPAKVFWSYGTKVRPGTTILFLAGCVPLDADGNLVGKGDIAPRWRNASRISRRFWLPRARP